MFYRGPSRFLWFAFGAFAATCYHQTQTRGESRGWGRCGNRRIEEWRAERAAREQWPTNTSYQEKNETTTGKCPRTPAAPPLSEDDVVRRRWEEKAKDAQDTVRISSNHSTPGILTEIFGNSGCRPV